VEPSMPRDEARRYAQAVYFAVVDRDVTSALGDQFAHWWSTSGWMFHREIPDGFANWATDTFPRAVDDE
jgi:hypothetical protein